MNLRRMSVVLLVALVGAFLIIPFGAQAATKDKKFLQSVPVSGTLADGGTFKGKVNITQFGYNNGLTVSGVLNGTATTSDGVVHRDIRQSFTNVRATLNEGAGVTATGFQVQATCSILDLDIGAIHLDLLGLVVDLAPIHLDITAVSGAGNLLGNLLCAVAGLLDPNGILDPLLGTLQQLLDLLTTINNLIG